MLPANVLAVALLIFIVPVPVKIVGTAELEYEKPLVIVTVLEPIARVLWNVTCERTKLESVALNPFVFNVPCV